MTADNHEPDSEALKVKMGEKTLEQALRWFWLHDPRVAELRAKLSAALEAKAQAEREANHAVERHAKDRGELYELRALVARAEQDRDQVSRWADGGACMEHRPEVPSAPETEPVTDKKLLLEIAWGVIANVSGGDWSKQPEDWVRAAEAWRDDWLASIHPRKHSRDCRENPWVANPDDCPACSAVEQGASAPVRIENRPYGSLMREGAEPSAASAEAKMDLGKWHDPRPSDKVSAGALEQKLIHTLFPNGGFFDPVSNLAVIQAYGDKRAADAVREERRKIAKDVRDAVVKGVGPYRATIGLLELADKIERGEL